MIEIVLIGLALIVALAVLVGAWIDIAYLGIMVRAWGFGRPRVLPHRGEKAVLWHRFGKCGPLVGWLFSPWEVIITDNRLIINFRNAFNRLDIPLETVRTISIRRKPWPFSDDILIGYTDHGTPKQFHLFDNSSTILKGLDKANASYELI